MKNLNQVFRRSVSMFPDKEALVFYDTRFTYSQLDERTNQIANAFNSLGFRKGDRICILQNNCYRLIEIYLALLKIGAVAVPLNTRLVGPELEYIINNAEAKALIVNNEFKPIIDKIRGNLFSIEHFLAIGDLDNMINYDEFIKTGGTDDIDVDVDEDDVAFQFYTSGTTGKPKGCMLTHGNFLANNTSLLLETKINEDDRHLDFLPIWHIGGTGLFWATFSRGGTSIAMRKFDEDELLKLIDEERITYACIVPEPLRRLVNHPSINKYNYDSLRLIIHGGAPMPLDLLAEVKRIFQCELVATFGQTECVGTATMLPDKYHVAEGTEEELMRAGSCGKVHLNVELRIVDENGKDVLPGEPGEIIVRGRSVMKGYWKMPDKTSETIKDGWLYTGDVGKLDSKGFLYILDRTKDMIRSASENIYPKEVEDVIYKHPSVSEVAVIGVPDAKWGEAVKALIVLKENCSATEDEIIELCKENLASYKKPKSVEFRAEPLPRNDTGKILKKVLREPFWEGYERRIH